MVSSSSSSSSFSPAFMAAATAAAALVWASVLIGQCFAGDPFAFFDWNVEYDTASPLGVPQQVILL